MILVIDHFLNRTSKCKKIPSLLVIDHQNGKNFFFRPSFKELNKVELPTHYVFLDIDRRLCLSLFGKEGIKLIVLKKLSSLIFKTNLCGKMSHCLKTSYPVPLSTF